MTLTGLQRSLAGGVIIMATVAVVDAQDSDGPPGAAFEVASVKRFQPSADRRGSSAIDVMPGGRVTAAGASVRDLIAAAYDVPDIQIVDAQRVLPDDRFEIEARTKPDVSVEGARAMLRRLLAERFRLAVHRETRELPVYVLAVDGGDRRLGDQLRPSAADCAPIKGPGSAFAASFPPFAAAPPPPPPAPAAGRVLSLGAAPLRCPGFAFSSSAAGHWSIREITMARFAERLVGVLGRPVVDRTGLQGPYDLELTYIPDSAVAAASNAPSLLTALREQLGLRLESTRAPVDVVVIDGVQPPSEN